MNIYQEMVKAHINSKQGTFIPREFFMCKKYREMSYGSKVVYGFLLRRFFISKENDFKDKSGNIIFIYSKYEMEKRLNISKKTIIKIFKELKEYGIIEEKNPKGYGANLIYLKAPYCDDGCNNDYFDYNDELFIENMKSMVNKNN